MAPPISAGQLRQRVRFERKAKAEDGYGNTESDLWVPVFEGSRAARLLPRAGGEEVVAARAQGIVTWDLWVRSDAATRLVTTEHRVVDARNPASTFNIRFVADMDGKGAWLLMQLEQGGAD